MNIAVVTTQSPRQSTLKGRIQPMATHLAQQYHHQIHILGHQGQSQPNSSQANITFHPIGRNPWSYQNGSKQRLHGFRLILRLLKNTIATCRQLHRLQPTAIIIAKPLPQNVAATSLYLRWQHLTQNTAPRVVLDIDDYELTANQLTSLLQRAAVHWSEQEAHRLAHHVVAATPFLEEYSRQLAGHLPRTLIPTAIAPPRITMTEQANKNPVILYIGSLSISSGHRVDLLPDILRRVRDTFPNITLRLAGDGHDRSTLQQQLQDANLTENVSATGPFSPADLPEILQDVAVIIDPVDATITNRAKSSYRAALAATLGIPYLSSNIGIRPLWFPESLHDQFFAQPEDPADYAQTLINLLQNPLTDAHKTSMVDHANRFSWSSLVPLYQKALLP